MALAAAAALAAHAALDAAGGSEGAYLALLAGAVLAAAALVAPAPAGEVAAGGCLAVLAGWALPPGPPRSAALLVLLVAVVAVATARRLSRTPGLPAGVALPLAYAAQLLLRGDLWIGRERDDLLALLLLPAAVGLAATLLARHRPRRAVLLAGFALLVLGPGWTPATALAAAALAGGDLLGRGGERPLARALGALAVAAPLVLGWPSGPLLLAAALALTLPERFTPFLAGLAMGSAGPLVETRWLAGLAGAAWLLLLLPEGVWTSPRHGGTHRATALGLAAAAGFFGLGAAGLAAPAALFALSLEGARGGRSVVQDAWAGILAAATALLAAYPWLRPAPLAAALGLVDLEPGWKAAGGLVAVAGLALVVARRRPAALLPARAVPAVAALLVAAAVLAAPHGGATPIGATPVVQDATRPEWRVPLAGPRAGAIVVDSSLSHAAPLAVGTPVAAVRLTAGGRAAGAWTLRAGVETGEWAARRPDLAGEPGAAAPPAWQSRVALGGRFFGQRYRARLDLPAPVAAPAELSVTRDPRLPPEVVLTIERLEVRPAAAGWRRFLPLPPGDPFGPTLLVLPLVVAALVAIGRTAARAGGPRPPAAARAGEGLALVLLAGLALLRRPLGLAGAEEAIAAGLVLLLAWRVSRLLPALRPLLGRRLPRRPAAAFFWLPAIVYLALLPWSTAHRPPDGDEPYYLLVAHSLAYDGDATLTDDYENEEYRAFLDRPLQPQPGDPRGPRGEIYSRHNLLLPLFLAPAYRLAGKTGALATMALLTAVLAWMVLRLARHYAPRRPGEALLAYAIAAFAPPLLLYSYQVWVEVPAALFAALALDQILTLRAEPPDGGRARRWLAIGLPVLLLPLLKIRFVLLAVPLLALAWWYAGRPRKPLLVLALLLALLSGGLLVYNQAIYGNPLKIHTWQEVELQRYAPGDFVRGGLGLFFDAAFGLAGCAPLWLLLVPAALLLARRRDRLLIDLAVLTLPYLLVVAPRREWYGGWSPPFRYALVALPLLALTLVPLLRQRRWAGLRAALAGLGALTLFLTLLWIVVPGWTYNFADGRTYLLDHLSERLGVDVARLFPSAVRPRPATWIWPLATLLLLPLVMLRRGRRRGAATWGIVALLVFLSAVPAAAARLPTRVVEAEDPPARRTGGHLFPDRWTFDRTRFRGGWVLRGGEELRAPVVAGGRRARLAVDVEYVRNVASPLVLEVYAGERLLGRWPAAEPRRWARLSFGPVDWPAGAPLVLAARGPAARRPLSGLIIDRVLFEWR